MIEWTLETIVFLILLVDSIAANAVAYLGDDKWWKKHFRIFSRYFPITKGWTTFYFILVLWMGVMLYRAGQISF